jgi:hypothetical protein
MIGSENPGGTTIDLKRAEKSWQVNTTLDKWADESLI